MEQVINNNNNNETLLFKAFLNEVYKSISQQCSLPLDSFLFQEITAFPLFIAEKLYKTFIKGSLEMTQELFTEGLFKLLLGNIKQLTELLFDVQDYDNDGKISYEDSKLFFIHLHMYLNDQPSKSEGKLYQIIMNFYKNLATIDKADFIWKTMNNNGDLVKLFYAFIRKMTFVTQEQFDYYKEITTTSVKTNKRKDNGWMILKGNWKIIGSGLLQSKDLNEYLYENHYEGDDNDDNEDMDQLEKFEEDISNVITSYANDDYNNNYNEAHHCSTETKDNSEDDNKQYGEIESPKHCTSTSVDLFTIAKRRIFNLPSKHLSHTTSQKNVCKYSFNPSPSLPSPHNQDTIDQVVFTIKNFNEQYFHQPSTPHKSSTTNITRPSIKFTYDEKSIQYKKLTLIDNIIYESIFNRNTTNYSFQRIIYLNSSYPQSYNAPPIQIDSEWLYPFRIISCYHGIEHSHLYFLKSRGECNTFISILTKSLKCRKITNDYILYDNTLGKGKFGIVKSGKSLSKDCIVAIKVINKTPSNYHLNQWEKSICLFLSHIDNAFIIKPLDVYETLEEIYYVYENIKGGDLNNFIKTRDNSSEVLLQIAYQMIEAVDVLHSYGIIHRDIKHSNILIDDTDGDENVCIKVIDFGLSRVIGHNEMVDCPYGSLSFKAPEVMMDIMYDFKVDIWSLGVTLFYITFKVLPFLHKNKSQLKKIIIKGNYSFPYDCSENTDVCYTMLYSMINDCLIREYSLRPDCKKIMKKYFDQLHQTS